MLILFIFCTILSFEANAHPSNHEPISDTAFVHPSEQLPLTPILRPTQVTRHFAPVFHIEQDEQPITAMQSLQKLIADPVEYAEFRHRQENLQFQFSRRVQAANRLAKDLRPSRIAQATFLLAVARGSLLLDRDLWAIDTNSDILLKTVPEGSVRAMHIHQFSDEQERLSELKYDETKRKAAATLHAIIGSNDGTGNHSE